MDVVDVASPTSMLVRCPLSSRYFSPPSIILFSFFLFSFIIVFFLGAPKGPPMDVGDATSTTSMDVVKVGLEKQVGLELEGIQG